MTIRGFRAVGLALLLSAMGSAATAGVKEGVAAWQAGDYAKAVTEWRGPAEQGDADAQFNLGQAYKLGRGVAADSKAAQSWYLKAAQQNHQQAQANLGLIMFQNGDRQAAMPWLRKAAEGGEPRAQYVLGTAMFNGDLVPRDWPRAYALMTRAAAAGLPQAATSLQQMDQYISLNDRQAGIAMARDLEKGTALSSLTAPPPPPTRPQLPNPPLSSRKPTAKLPPKPAAPAQATAAAPTPKPATPVPAKPVPAPVVTKASPPEPAATAKKAPSGGWRIQLGAFGSATGAEKAWTEIAGKNGLKGKQPLYTPVKGLTRLQAGPFAGKVEANQVCAALQQAKVNCFPVAP